MEFEKYIRTIADFPRPGISFKDITPLLLDPDAFGAAVDAMAGPFVDRGVDLVAGAEARGFLFAPQVAARLHAGFVPVRKPGKLPGKTLGLDYALEYGTDRLEIHQDQIPPGARVVIVDDLLATGGTVLAARNLVEMAGARVVGFSFFIELSFLGGRGKLGDIPVFSAVRYGSEVQH